MKDSVMVIGAGRGQIPIMELSKKYGFKVVAVSPQGDYPGISYADDVVFSDVRDFDNIRNIATEKKIKYVLTDQLDVGVYTAAYVSESLGIKGITSKVAQLFTNKYLMRQAADQAGISVPKNILVNNLEELETKIHAVKFPLMMKPVDSDASRGVFKVESIEDIYDHYKTTISYSKTNQIILEEFIAGQEYVIEAYTHNYQVNNLVVGHRDYFDIKGTFIPCATLFQDADSANSDLEKRLKDINKRLITAFGLSFGITHAEYLYNIENDTIYLVEIAARGGGVFISSDLIPLACGVNANDLYVRDVFGLTVPETIVLSKGASAYFCYMTPEGTICKLDNIDKISKIEGVHKAFFDNIELGMKTSSIRDKSSRKGPILVRGNTKEDCYKVIERVKSCLDIKILTSDGEKDIIWN